MLRLSEDHLNEIRSHGASEFPLECCGVILGSLLEGGKTVAEVRRLTNMFAPSLEFERSVAVASDELIGQERRFMVAPETMMQLMREERRTGIKVLGFYHSHPNHPARPSEYDRVWAMPWYSYVIVSVMDSVPADLTSWTLAEDGSRFEAEPLEVIN